MFQIIIGDSIFDLVLIVRRGGRAPSWIITLGPPIFLDLVGHMDVDVAGESCIDIVQHQVHNFEDDFI